MMTLGSPQLGRHVFSINTAHFAGAVGDHASGQVDVTVRAADGPTLVSMTDQDIEVPLGSPVLDHLLAAAMAGTVTYLTRQGRRVAAVLPADIAESVLQEPPGQDDDGRPVPPAGAGRRTLAQLRREQGVQPVQDPAELRGAELADFDQFFSAAMSARSQ
jgi:hypothetical protein